ncbi:MAG TPA: DUF58 domain-containing protein [Armatimonadota bacterium]|nr:DUF58 domain-containing protein [Armatimonadota bacterium]
MADTHPASAPAPPREGAAEVARALPATAAAGLAALLSPGFLRSLERLRLVSRRTFLGRQRGERRSPRRGASVEFADFRNYVPGDDPRHLDWNACARLSRLFLKLFVEEEDLYVTVLVDTSESMSFGEPSKAWCARQAAAAIAYVGLCSLDRLSVYGFAPRLGERLGPLRGRGCAPQCLRWLAELPVGGATDLAGALKAFAVRAVKPGVAVVISDFLAPDYQQGLKALIQRRHDVTALQVLAPEEIAPGLAGDLRLIDAETGEAREISITRGLLREYGRRLDEHQSGFHRFCLRYGINGVQLVAGESFEELALRALWRQRLVT